MLRDAKGLVRSDIDASLTARGPVAEIDKAAVRLVREYADAIDRAQWTAEAVDKLIDQARDVLDWETAEGIVTELHRLAIKLEAQTVLATIGPKLLSAMQAIGLTPAARKAPGAPAAPPAKSGLQLLRDAEAADAG